MACVVAHHGKEALEKIAEYTITGMIVDMMMPTMDGVTLLSAITQLNPKPFINLQKIICNLPNILLQIRP